MKSILIHSRVYPQQICVVSLLELRSLQTHTWVLKEKYDSYVYRYTNCITGSPNDAIPIRDYGLYKRWIYGFKTLEEGTQQRYEVIKTSVG